MKLNYHMHGFEPVPAVDIDLEDPNQIHWLHSIVGENPDTIFFFTVDTTDIWNDGDYIVNHSCSCHEKQWGPCTVCRSLGCEVWDYNRVAGIPVITVPQLSAGLPQSFILDTSVKPPALCIGVKGCEALRHANDCPGWSED